MDSLKAKEELSKLDLWLVFDIAQQVPVFILTSGTIVVKLSKESAIKATHNSC